MSLVGRIGRAVTAFLADPVAPQVTDDGFVGKEDRAWTTKVACFKQELARDGSTVTMVGNCPNCSHDMSVVLPIQARTGERVTMKWDHQPVGRGGSRRFVKVAYCNCEAGHADRPEGVDRGCGRFGALLIGEETEEGKKEIGRDENHARHFVTVRPSKREAAITDVTWERLAETEASSMLAGARTSAEKWTAAVASLTGVFSIALVVKGPEDVTKVTGSVGELVGISSLLAIGFLVGGVALGTLAFVTRRKVPQGLEVVMTASAVVLVVLGALGVAEQWTIFTTVLVLLGLAVGLAATAIVAGTLAAYGLPRRFAAESGTALRERQVKQTQQARLLLRVLIGTTTCALVGIGGAIALTWIHTAKPSSSSLLVMHTTSGTDQVTCGTLASEAAPDGAGSGALVIRTAAGDNVSIARADVESVASVASC